MDIAEFQKEVLSAFSKMGELPNRCNHTKQSAVIHLMEEIGEISREVTNEVHRPERFKRESLATELADTMMFIVLLAKLYDIDLSKEMGEGVKRARKRADLLK